MNSTVDADAQHIDRLPPGFHAELLSHLSALFGSPTYKPPLLPTVALELIELCRNPNVSMRAVTSLLSSEAMLAASVLRIAQSPVYSPVSPPQSLEAAVVRLGADFGRWRTPGSAHRGHSDRAMADTRIGMADT